MRDAIEALQVVWRTICDDLPVPPAACLFRSTEGYNLDVVCRHGTDRHGRDRPMSWAARGYRGPPRAFAEVVFASTAAEVDASLTGARDRSALLKVPDTPRAHLLVYRADALEAVHTDQYAFIGSPRAALLAVYALDPVRRVV